MSKKKIALIFVLAILFAFVTMANIPGPATCSPGFWKQEQHFQYWAPSGVTPDMEFAPGMTYLQALQGGKATRETRFVVAGFLNSFYTVDTSPCPGE